MSIPLADALVRRFSNTFTQPPSWAWPFVPPIPFVGRNFQPGRGLLVYASAENLSWLYDQGVPSYFRGSDTWNRYRVQYESNGRRSQEFFPRVGVKPVTDGGLLVAALFVADRLTQRPDERLAIRGGQELMLRQNSARP